MEIKYNLWIHINESTDWFQTELCINVIQEVFLSKLGPCSVQANDSSVFVGKYLPVLSSQVCLASGKNTEVLAMDENLRKIHEV